MIKIDFLCNVAGADVELLKQCPETDRWKIAALGSAVLSIAIIAWLSFTAALIFIFQATGYPFFQRVLTYIVFLSIGFIWLLVIFNMYRLIISANGYGDGTSEITQRELIDNLFKIVMGIFLAVCISIPINTVLLHKEIISKLNTLQDEKIASLRKDIDEKYEDDLDNLYRSLASSTIQYEKIKNLARSNHQYQYVANQIATLKKDITLVRKKVDREKLEATVKVEKSLRLSLIEETKQAFILHKAISISVMIFTIVLCLGPIFLRMVWVKGVYEYICEFQDKLVLAKYGVHPEIEIFKNGEQVIQESYAVPQLILSQVVNKLEKEKAKSALKLKIEYKKRQNRLKKVLTNRIT